MLRCPSRPRPIFLYWLCHVQKPQLYGLVFPPTCSLPARLNLESSCHPQRISASSNWKGQILAPSLEDCVSLEWYPPPFFLDRFFSFNFLENRFFFSAKQGTHEFRNQSKKQQGPHRPALAPLWLYYDFKLSIFLGLEYVNERVSDCCASSCTLCVWNDSCCYHASVFLSIKLSQEGCAYSVKDCMHSPPFALCQVHRKHLRTDHCAALTTALATPWTLEHVQTKACCSQVATVTLLRTCLFAPPFCVPSAPRPLTWTCWFIQSFSSLR